MKSNEEVEGEVRQAAGQGDELGMVRVFLSDEDRKRGACGLVAFAAANARSAGFAVEETCALAEAGWKGKPS